MSILRQVLEIVELLDSARVTGEAVAALMRARGITDVNVTRVASEHGATDFVAGSIPGLGSGPTLGIIGRLGGIGARPHQIGLVSNGDGAFARDGRIPHRRWRALSAR